MYDLQKIVDRAHTCAKKTSPKGIEEALGLCCYGDTIPLWVADMDFACSPKIVDAIKARANCPIFGYTETTDCYLNAIISWYKRRHNMDIQKEWLVYSPGTVEGICNTIRAFSNHGDGVIIQPPVYPPFRASVKRTSRKLVCNPLIEKNGRYEIDFEGFERACADENNKVFILCNPHNPVGRIWSEQDVTKMAQICVKHNVVVFADEIHCDLLRSGEVFTPMMNVTDSPLIITATACNKSFNVAGLHLSNLVIKDKAMRDQFNKVAGQKELTPFGLEALKAAYNESEDWLDAVCNQIDSNFAYMKNFVDQHFSKVKFSIPQGTYLAWLDFRAYELSEKELVDLFANEAHVIVEGGSRYGVEGRGFIRINIACPSCILEEALNRIKKALDNFS